MSMKNYIFSLLAVSSLFLSSCREEVVEFGEVNRISQGIDMVKDWCSEFKEVAFDIEACFIINEELAKCQDLQKGKFYINDDKTVYIKRMESSSFRAVILEPFTACVETDGTLYTPGAKWYVWSTISSNFAEGFIGYIFPSNTFGVGKYYNFPMTLECMGSSWRLIGEKRGDTQRSNNIVVQRDVVDGKPILTLNGVGQTPLSDTFNFSEKEDVFPAFNYYMDYELSDIKWQSPDNQYDFIILSGELNLEIFQNGGIRSLNPSAVFNNITVTVSYCDEHKTLHHSEVYH